MLADTGLLLAILVAYLVSRKRYGDMFTPLFVYVAVWCGCLLLFRVRLVSYDPLGADVMVLIAGSMVAFVAGCLAAGRAPKCNGARLQIALPPLEKAIRILDYMNLVGLFLFVVRATRTFGLSAYLSEPDTIRLNYEDLGRIGGLALLLAAAFPLFACSLVHFLLSKKLRWFTVVGLLLPAAQGFVTMSRNNFAVPLISGVFVWFYFRGWRGLNRRLIAACAWAALVVALYFIGVGFWYGKVASSPEYSLYRNRDLNVTSAVGLQLIVPYMYATGNFPTLQAAMGEVHGRLWGQRTFFPAARLFYGMGLLQNRPENASLEFYFVPVPFNTETYLFGLYEDFGTVGVIVGPFLFGLLGTALYLRMRTRPSLFSMGGAAAVMAVVVYSVFISLGSTIQVWYWITALLIISRRCCVDDDKQEECTKNKGASAAARRNEQWGSA